MWSTSTHEVLQKAELSARSGLAAFQMANFFRHAESVLAVAVAGELPALESPGEESVIEC